MISKILLKQVASYIDAVEIEPTEINYLYGSNGSGKTTISNVIADQSFYSESSITWKLSQLETLVYNKQFVDTNFGQSKKIKGIFTLGKNSVDAYNNIIAAKEEIANIDKMLSTNKKSLDTLNDRIKDTENEAIKRSWSVKEKYDLHFSPAYAGFNGSKKKFLNQCVAVRSSNKLVCLSIEDILEKCGTIFNSTIKQEELIQPFEFSEITRIEFPKLLSESIVGKEDGTISELINKLQNSDWVREGAKFIEQTADQCPFCQQKLNQQIIIDINNFFDKNYINKVKELETYKESYIAFSESIKNELRKIIKLKIAILDTNLLVTKVHDLQEVVNENLAIIDKKIKSPSIAVELKSMSPYLNEIRNEVDVFIDQINKNNIFVENIHSEQIDLKRDIWQFIAHDLDRDLEQYLNKTDGFQTGKAKLIARMHQLEIDKNSLLAKVFGWESEVTDTMHTVNEINKTLSLFSFTSFKLEQASETGFYRVIRENGTEGHETLSEGEYRFITFLYFYHLLKGSLLETGMTKDKVVVFDDPISSLDSSVLFVVSNLIKNVIRSCKTSSEGIKQVFILTHNVHFFKEVTFRGSKHSGQWKEESFWIIKKLDNMSKIKHYLSNPIKTSYELLWREISDINKVSNVTVFNTLRRILEYYFNIIGGLDYEDCICQFEGEEQLVCKSLLSWMNDGSHSVHDDFVFHIEHEEIEKYLAVFELVFKKMDHKSHYDMMMRTCAEIR